MSSNWCFWCSSRIIFSGTLCAQELVGWGMVLMERCRWGNLLLKAKIGRIEHSRYMDGLPLCARLAFFVLALRFLQSWLLCTLYKSPSNEAVDWCPHVYTHTRTSRSHIICSRSTPRVTAVARKRSRSFCQKCRWQVAAKHACILRMWLCMKWHGAWLYGVHRTRRDGSSFTWHQRCQCCKYTTSVDIQKCTIKS